MEKQHVTVCDENGVVIARGFKNVLAAAIWCNLAGWAHPFLRHNRYHTRGKAVFTCELIR